MVVTGIDERCMVGERIGGNFVVFIYEGPDEDPGASVDSYLLTDAGLPEVMRWLQGNLPVNSCWSLGVRGTPDPDATVRPPGLMDSGRGLVEPGLDPKRAKRTTASR